MLGVALILDETCHAWIPLPRQLATASLEFRAEAAEKGPWRRGTADSMMT